MARPRRKFNVVNKSPIRFDSCPTSSPVPSTGEEGDPCEATWRSMGEMRDQRQQFCTACPSPIPSLRDGPLSSPAEEAGEDMKGRAIQLSAVTT
jgi:hypothetical protein